MSIFIRTVPNVMRHFDCSQETAQRYMDLRDEGYGAEQARLMAGLSDPPEAACDHDYLLAEEGPTWTLFRCAKCGDERRDFND